MGQGAQGCRPATRREPRGWQARWLELNAELVRLQASHPLIDAVVDEVDGRRIRIGDRWLDDFASCNYLGFDLDPEIIEGIPDYLHRWGTHPSWSRMLASPVLYERIEAELSELLGAEDVLALPTLTLISASVIPALAAGGTILVDARAHKTVYDGCVVARGQGATLRRYAHDDPGDLERQLRAAGPGPCLICMDGVNSMTGNPPDLPTLARLARELAAVLLGLQVNARRGDRIRADLYAQSRRVLDRLAELGMLTLNRTGFPLMEIPLADPDDLDAVGRYLFDHGIYVTLAFYPGVPRREVGFRVQMTAANTDEQVDHLLDVLGQLADRFRFRARA